MKVTVAAACDNYDRIGNVNLALVPKGATTYVPASVPRIELGADAVLVNTAIAVVGQPVAMARAFRLAVEARRLAYEARLAAPRRPGGSQLAAHGFFWIRIGQEKPLVMLHCVQQDDRSFFKNAKISVSFRPIFEAQP